MIAEEIVVEFLAEPKSRRMIILAILATLLHPASTAAIRAQAMALGVRQVGKWNLSDTLKKAAKSGHIAQLGDGWKTLKLGMLDLETQGLFIDSASVSDTKHSLRKHLKKISDADRRRFIGEAISSFEVGNFRAAVLLSWVGAVHIIQEYVVSKGLFAFNKAGSIRFGPKFSKIKNIKGFAVIGEGDFLQLCQDAGLIDKAEKQEFLGRLGLRNRCGHPNSIKIAEHTVAHHMEILLLNIYQKY